MKKRKFQTSIKPVATIFVFIFVFMFFGVGCGNVPEEPIKSHDKFQIITQIKTDKKNPFFIDFKKFPAERKNLPIGVFDSGTGGLTVLNSIVTLDRFNNKTHEPGSDGIPDFISERFVYLGDKANMPYGRYDSEGKSDFLKELIIKDVQFLLKTEFYHLPGDAMPRGQKEPAKTVVIACNTATAFGYDLVAEALEEWGVDIKVLGIIDAGAESAVTILPGTGTGQVIGVMATEGTCASNGYPRAVKKEFFRRFEHHDIAVVQQAGFGLAAAIDGDIDYIDPEAVTTRGKQKYQGPGVNHPIHPIDPGLWEDYAFDTGNHLLIRKDSEGNMMEVELNSVGNYIKYHVTQLMVKLAKTYPDRQLGAVILGCTHYPFFEKEITDHFMYLKNLKEKYHKIIPEKVILVDPAEALAVELYEHLEQKELFCPGCNNSDSAFFISVANPLLAANQIEKNGEFPFSYKYGRAINLGVQFVKRVPFSRQWIKEEVLKRIQVKMPDIYRMVAGPGIGSDKGSEIDSHPAIENRENH